MSSPPTSPTSPGKRRTSTLATALANSGFQKPKMRVAIVGGGLCGLSLAVVLARSPALDVMLFESAAQFGEVGAGVVLGSNAVLAFQNLGLLDNICTHTKQKPQCNDLTLSVDPGQGKGVEEDVIKLKFSHPPGDLAVSRVTFLESLIPLFPSRQVHFNKRCLDITRNAASSPASDPFTSPSDSSSNSNLPAYRVHFKDGTYFDADLVVGADGVRSTVRRVLATMQSGPDLRPTVLSSSNQEGKEAGQDPVYDPPLGSTLGEDRNLSFSGCRIFRSVIPYLRLKRAGMKMDVRKHLITLGPTENHLFSVPICNGTMINMGAYCHDASSSSSAPRPPLPHPWTLKDVENAEIAKLFDAWGDDVRAFVGNMGDTSSMWALHSLNPVLETYAREGIVLVGDAAHAMTPHMGAGVGQGIEDVFLLSNLLIDTRTNLKNLPIVLQAYDRIRRPRANWALETSGKIGRMYGELGPDVSTEELQERLKELEAAIERVQTHDVQSDLDGAVAWLKEGGVY